MDRRRRLPQLNFHILRIRSVYNVLTKLSNSLSSALTRSTEKESALERRPSMSPVVLSDVDSVERFCNLIFPDAIPRASSIYGLFLSFSLSDPMDGPRWSILAPRLAAILEAATHLEYLHLSATIRDPVFTAAAKVTSIQELIVHVDPSRPSSREALRNFLTILRSPLRRLHINDDYEENSGIYASFIHENLAHFASNLEVLELNYLVLDVDPSAVTTPFVAVRSLKIVASCYSASRFLPAETLLRLFPNLRQTLEIGALVILCEDGPRYDRAAERERSKEIQTASTWSGLDHVICDTDAAFSLALRCPINRMEINTVWFPTEERDLAEILRYNTPQKLLFSCDAMHMNHLLFLSEATDKLTHLVMSVTLDVNHPSKLSQTARGAGNRVDIPWNQLTVRRHRVACMFCEAHAPHRMIF